MQLVVDGKLTTYTEVGSGKKNILFLHGWGDSSTTFEMLAKDIVKENKQYKAILLDLPGFGGTSAPKEAWGLEEYASFVADFLKKSKLQASTVVGHSNGGAIAIKGLSSHKLDADNLVLIASAGIRDPSLKKKALKAASVPAKLALKALPKSSQKKVRKKLYGAVGSDYLVVENMQDTFKRVVSSDVAESASKLKLPVCLIYGALDDPTPPELGVRLSKIISGSKFNLIAEAGHFVHQEQVYKVSRLIRQFIK